MDQDNHSKLMRWATRASVAVASVLVGTKAVAWWLSDSVAMMGSLADSSLDLAASLVTLFAVRTALMPPDEDHRFGHGKAEALAGLFQAAIMSGSAVFLTLESVQRVADPAPTTHSTIVMGISAVAIVLSLGLVSFQALVVRRTGSLAVAGDHLHYKGDLLLNLSVIIAAWATAQGIVVADGIMGALIGVYILYGAFGIARPSVDMLMDKEFPDADREQILEIVLAAPEVIGAHDLKTRLSGRDRFIQLHIEVDATMPVRQAHMITTELVATIGEVFSGSEVFIHVDPPTGKADTLTQQEFSNTPPSK